MNIIEVCSKNPKFVENLKKYNIQSDRGITTELENYINNAKSLYDGDEEDNFVNDANIILNAFADMKLKAQQRLFKSIHKLFIKFESLTLNDEDFDIARNEKILNNMSMDIVSAVFIADEEKPLVRVIDNYDGNDHYKVYTDNRSNVSSVLIGVVGNEDLSEMGGELERIRLYAGLNNFKNNIPLLVTIDQTMNLEYGEVIEESAYLYASIWSFLRGFDTAAMEVYSRTINKELQ